MERIQKIMARAGVGSRRYNEQLIKAGRVRVNGSVARLGQKANQGVDVIEVDDQVLEFQKFIYIKIYKPKGVLSSTEDELKQNRETVRDLIDIDGHLYPIGRLDKQSEGLMIMTNDGNTTHRLTHPRFGHTKVYNVILEGYITDNQIYEWQEGVILDGRRTIEAGIKILTRDKRETHLEITMREGKKRQIRRIASIFGHPVLKLRREKMGPVSLGELKPGDWRFLSDSEINALMKITQEKKDI